LTLLITQFKKKNLEVKQKENTRRHESLSYVLESNYVLSENVFFTAYS